MVVSLYIIATTNSPKAIPLLWLNFKFFFTNLHCSSSICFNILKLISYRVYPWLPFHTTHSWLAWGDQLFTPTSWSSDAKTPSPGASPVWKYWGKSRLESYRGPDRRQSLGWRSQGTHLCAVILSISFCFILIWFLSVYCNPLLQMIIAAVQFSNERCKN